MALKRPRLGLWYDFRNPPEAGRSFATLYDQTLEQIAYAERLGFDDAWTSEHHFIPDGYSPSLLPICAAIAMRTTTMRIGTNVLLLPLHDPLRVAEDAATVDIISNGRFDLGVAVGYKLEEFRGFNKDRHKRGRMMDEAVQVIRRAWDEGEFTFEGRYYRYESVNVLPKPVQRPCPLWIGGMSEAAIRRAGRFGDGLLGIGRGTMPAFLEEWTKRGRDPNDVKLIVGPGSMRVCEDPDRAWSELGRHALYQSQNYSRWFGAAGQSFGPYLETVDELRQRNPRLFVTPDQAVEVLTNLVTYARTLIPDPEIHLYWWSVLPGEPVESSTRGLELFSSKVLPGFRAWTASEAGGGER